MLAAVDAFGLLVISGTPLHRCGAVRRGEEMFGAGSGPKRPATTKGWRSTGTTRLEPARSAGARPEWPADQRLRPQDIEGRRHTKPYDHAADWSGQEARQAPARTGRRPGRGASASGTHEEPGLRGVGAARARTPVIPVRKPRRAAAIPSSSRLRQGDAIAYTLRRPRCSGRGPRRSSGHGRTTSWLATLSEVCSAVQVDAQVTG